MSKLPLALVGPSGVGKTTLVNFLISHYSNFFSFSVSSTTRIKRPNEIEGKNYHFLSKSEFLTKIGKNEFIEYAEVHGNFYGTTKQAILEIKNKGKICLLDIDVQGIINLFNSGFEFNRICIVPKDEASIRKRLIKRGTESNEIIELRMNNMHKELKIIDENKPIFNNFVVNEELDKCQLDLTKIISVMYPEIK